MTIKDLETPSFTGTCSNPKTIAPNHFEPSGPRRLHELDSVRGLAALSVVLGHLSRVWLDDGMFSSSQLSRGVFTYALYPFTEGHSAVMLFFILSVFVLSIPAINLRPQSYSAFVTRRIFRIYVPYLVAIVLAVICDMFLHGQVTRSQWLNASWSAPVNWRLIIQHVIFIGKYDSAQFDPPIWSLIYEMRISLIFPFLCAFVLCVRPAVSLLLAFSISVLSISGEVFTTSTNTHLPVFGTLHYTALFILGIYLARQKDSISVIYSHLSRRTKIMGAVSSALLYVYAGDLWFWISRQLTSYNLVDSSDWLTAIGAAGLIALSLNSGMCRRILLWPPIYTLGKMSYSIYLLHFIIMLLLLHLLYRKLPLLMILLFSLAATVAVSWAFYRLVEVSSLNLGRKLSSYL